MTLRAFVTHRWSPIRSWPVTVLLAALLALGCGAHSGQSASERAAPEGTAPDGTAPDGTAPEGTAPDGTAPDGTAPAGTTPEPSRVLATGSLVRLLLPSDTPFREEHDGFSVRFRVQNTSPQDVYLDLASPTLVHPNQFGPLTSNQRLIIDERRLDADPLSAAEIEALRSARRDGALTRLRAGERLDVYVPFHGTGAQMFMGFATPWVVISLDGHLDMLSDAGDAARLSLAWNDERSATDTDIVMSMPVVLDVRDCRERRVMPRYGSREWPVVTCSVP